MLADEVDYVIGVDPHRDTHTFAVVEAGSGGLVFDGQVAASVSGYLEALRSAGTHVLGRRAWAIEGTGSYGAGLSRFLAERGELVVEVGRLRRQRRSQAKTDALDALRTARSVLGETRLAEPRVGGERDGLRALMVARESALVAKKACLCQLRALIVTCPEPLRTELAPLTRARLLSRCVSLRPDRHKREDWRATLLALRSLAARAQALTLEERALEREIRTLVTQLAPQLLTEPGVGPISAAQLVISWSHPAASAAKPPSPASPAPPRSQPPQARPSATASTVAATASSTAPCKRSSSPAAVSTQPRSPTSNDAEPKARPAARASAASSATSPATSTDSSRPNPNPLDNL